jgi:hypothetical protein
MCIDGFAEKSEQSSINIWRSEHVYIFDLKTGDAPNWTMGWSAIPLSTRLYRKRSHNFD